MRALICLLSLLVSVTAAAKKSDQFDFRFRPIGLVVGSLSLDLDIVIAPEWTLGPELAYWHLAVSSPSNFTSSYNITAFGAGARGNWFKNGVYTDGLYVGPSVKYVSDKLSVTDANGTTLNYTVSGMFLGCLVGYGWFWESFNILLGGGAELGLGTAANFTITDSSGQQYTVSNRVSGLDVEFSLGWTF